MASDQPRLDPAPAKRGVREGMGEFPVLRSGSDVAAAIGISTGELGWLTASRTVSRHDRYRRFEIAKRGGGTRQIAVPHPRLRRAQEWMQRALVMHLPVHEAATAFRPGASVRWNALLHSGRSVVVRIDLEDFFSSIDVNRVCRLFQSWGYRRKVAILLALLATDAHREERWAAGERRFVAVGPRGLPQGACTSPGISNAVCWQMDQDLTDLGRGLGFAFTRYADDLVFSTNCANFPEDVLICQARRVIRLNGFHVNEAKTRVMRSGGRQVVTGLVVNGEEPRVPRPDLRRFRAFLHHCEMDGFDAVSQRIGKDALNYARGYLAWIHMVSPEQAARFRARHPWLASGRRD